MMHSLSSVTIDVGVVAVPKKDCTKEEAFQYVETLLDWSKLLKESWVSVYVSERASETLIASCMFPMRDKLTELFNEHGITEFDVNTVAKQVNQLLCVTPSFETYYCIKDVLSENLITDPILPSLTTHDPLQSDLDNCVILIAILRKYCLQPLGGMSLIVKKAPTQLIKVKVQIHLLEHSREDILNLPCPPEFFKSDILICERFHGFIECHNETAILVNASDNFGVELAIRIALFKYSLSQGFTPNWECFLIPNIGKSFRELCQQCCRSQGGSLPYKILRAIVETIKGHNLSAVHALRSAQGGNAPQKLRGTDKAQRRDIDREFHLHYWECTNSTIELASVVYHNDFTIPE